MVRGGGKNMIFRSKVDRFFIIMLLVVIFSMGLVTLGPLFIEKERTILPSIIMSTIFILCTSFFAWITFGNKYVFTDEYLLVKGGPFPSKIRYENITKVAKTNDIFTGFRLNMRTSNRNILHDSEPWQCKNIAAER